MQPGLFEFVMVHWPARLSVLCFSFQPCPRKPNKQLADSRTEKTLWPQSLYNQMFPFLWMCGSVSPRLILFTSFLRSYIWAQRLNHVERLPLWTLLGCCISCIGWAAGPAVSLLPCSLHPIFSHDHKRFHPRGRCLLLLGNCVDAWCCQAGHSGSHFFAAWTLKDARAWVGFEHVWSFNLHCFYVDVPGLWFAYSPCIKGVWHHCS